MKPVRLAGTATVGAVPTAPVTVTPAVTTIGKLSPAEIIPVFRTTMRVPAAGVGPMNCNARVIVRNAHDTDAVPPEATPLPVALTSLPPTGSTSYTLLVVSAQDEQVWLVQTYPT